MNEIIEITKYGLPSLIVLAITYFLLKSFLDSEYKKRHLEIRIAANKIALPIRLQAYERLALFLERITPNNLVMRVMKSSNISAQQLQIDLINTARNELNHNLSQQIYISDEAWNLIKNTNEEIIKMINIATSKLPDDATGKDLSRVILEMTMSVEKLPTTVALEFLKNEAKQIF